MVPSPTVHLPLGALLSPCTMCDTGGGNSNGGTGLEEGAGGGGSGGTIHLIASTIEISGTVSALGGLGGTDDGDYFGGSRLCCSNGGVASDGRIRLDYATLVGTTRPAPGFHGHLAEASCTPLTPPPAMLSSPSSHPPPSLPALVGNQNAPQARK